MPFDDTMFLKNKVDILSLFNEDQLRKVTPDIEHQNYAKGETVLLKGEVTSGFYIIKRGKVSVLSRKGEVEHRKELQAGEFFGEISLLEDTAATASIKAVEDGTEVLMIPHQSFQKLLQMHPIIKKALLDRVAADRGKA